jgi:hypothetical protein
VGSDVEGDDDFVYNDKIHDNSILDIDGYGIILV